MNWTPSTPTSTVTSSHAHGELSPQSFSLLHACPLAHKYQYVMSPRPTGQSLQLPLSGLVWSSVSRQRTNLQLTPATTLDLPQQEVSTAWLLTQGWTYSDAMGWVQYQSGLTIMCSSESHGPTSQITMPNDQSGSMRYISRGVRGRVAAGYGMGVKTSQMAQWKNLTRTAPPPSKTSQTTPHVQPKTVTSPMHMPTSTKSQHDLASNGSPPKLSHFKLKSLILTFTGTCKCASSTYSRRREPNTSQ